MNSLMQKLAAAILGCSLVGSMPIQAFPPKVALFELSIDLLTAVALTSGSRALYKRIEYYLLRGPRLLEATIRIPFIESEYYLQKAKWLKAKQSAQNSFLISLGAFVALEIIPKLTEIFTTEEDRIQYIHWLRNL